MIGDGYSNLMSRLGTTADRSTAAFYWVPPLSQGQIEAAYRTSWLTRKVHDLPAFEMTRAGRKWNAKKDQITALEQYERRRTVDVWGKLRRALTVARLHGGAALIMGVRSGGSADPSKPLDPERVGKEGLRYLLVASRHQLSAPFGMETDPESDFYGEPAMYELRGGKGTFLRVHPSRVIPFRGMPLPEGSVTLSALDQFWGDPLLQSIQGAINNSETAQAAVATLLHEMKQDVISIPGLTEQIATEGAEARIGARIEALNRFRSMFNALLLDGGDEEGKGGEKWETRQLAFTQHPELLRQFLAIVGGAADIPATRLMGESPGGLQSTGKGEQDDFNRMIDARRQAEIAPGLTVLDEVLIRSTFGSRDPDISYEFGDLTEPDETSESENDKRDAETVQIYVSSGLIPRDALAKSAANRMIESGRWPGLDQAIQESAEELGLPDDDETPDPVEAAAEMAERGTITQDQAARLMLDAQPRSLYVRRDLVNADEFKAWARSQGFTPDDGLHVAVAYSRRPVDWIKADNDWPSDKNGGFTVEPGGPRVVETLGDKGAIVLIFASSHLAYRHERIRELSGAGRDFSEYTPHVTIQYGGDVDLSAVEPYRGALRFGPEIFEEVRGGAD
jgi:phage-related protein (TIGR01555 family)